MFHAAYRTRGIDGPRCASQAAMAWKVRRGTTCHPGRARLADGRLPTASRRGGSPAHPRSRRFTKTLLSRGRGRPETSGGPAMWVRRLVGSQFVIVDRAGLCRATLGPAAGRNHDHRCGAPPPPRRAHDGPIVAVHRHAAGRQPAGSPARTHPGAEPPAPRIALPYRDHRPPAGPSESPDSRLPADSLRHSRAAHPRDAIARRGVSSTFREANDRHPERVGRNKPLGSPKHRTPQPMCDHSVGPLADGSEPS